MPYRPPMPWFDQLFGFAESRRNVERHIIVDGERLTSRANGRSFRCGHLEIVTLAQLRERAAETGDRLPGPIRVREVVADAQSLHTDPANAGALFQVASQFNLLEMVAPDVTPDRGITRYQADPTQGPACAVACAAGTLQRNWLAQTTSDQIDTLAAVGRDLGNQPDRRGRGRWWRMQNGYALLTGELPTMAAGWPDHHDHLAIGLQTDTEVTLDDAGHVVSQAYCSALPIAYSSVEAADVEPLGRLVLNSAYEATLAAAVLNAARPDGNPTVYLTLLGGGVFGNPLDWIVDAMARAIERYRDVAIDVAIVSFRRPNPAVAPLLSSL